ncbi:MAG: type II toxin-antitoxin system RelE/ParE family toxin [Gemmatimonadota bacterium]|nr:type II toxin-antitoxin system RelE/ParE family toxin [Gemmatimonadota bacterium]
MKVRFRTEAAADVAAAREWYDEQRVGLGDEFVSALERMIEMVGQLPEAFPEIAAGHRRALLGQFPYALYYRIDSDVVDIVACLHSRRSPSRWRQRGEV